jgi:hypothetical protein
MQLTDLTAAAKSLLVSVDANKAYFLEAAGAAGSLLTLDLANNRVGVATADPTVPLDVVGAIKGSTTINAGTTITAGTTIVAGTSVVAGTGFGCNSKAAQTAYETGAALAAYADGTKGLASTANMEALVAKVNAIEAALIANGICS